MADCLNLFSYFSFHYIKAQTELYVGVRQPICSGLQAGAGAVDGDAVGVGFRMRGTGGAGVLMDSGNKQQQSVCDKTVKVSQIVSNKCLNV